MPVLEAFGLANPGPAVPQSDVRRKAEEVLAVLAPDLLDKMDVFDHTGIRSRHFVRPIDWFLDQHGWEERAAIYRETGIALLEEATTRALAEARLAPSDVDGIVLVSSTGIAAPSLEAALVDRLGMRVDVTRAPLWGLGCVGGVAGLDLAATLARGSPEERYLLLSLELCSLAFNLSDMSVRAFIANTLFADGCAAALVRGDARRDGPSGLGRLLPGASHQWPDSERVMGWDVTDGGLRVVFSRKIPELVANDLAPVVERYVKATGASPDRWLLHPGGTKVLEAYEASLGLRRDALAASYATLRDFGNMSSPTVLYVAASSLRARTLAPGEHALLGALGPGFTAHLAMLEGLPARG